MCLEVLPYLHQIGQCARGCNSAKGTLYGTGIKGFLLQSREEFLACIMAKENLETPTMLMNIQYCIQHVFHVHIYTLK